MPNGGKVRSVIVDKLIHVETWVARINQPQTPISAFEVGDTNVVHVIAVQPITTLKHSAKVVGHHSSDRVEFNNGKHSNRLNSTAQRWRDNIDLLPRQKRFVCDLVGVAATIDPILIECRKVLLKVQGNPNWNNPRHSLPFTTCEVAVNNPSGP